MCLTGRWQWSIGPTWKVLENTPNENTTEHFDWQKPTLNPCRTAVCMPKITFWIRKRKIWVSKKSCLFANLAPNLPCLTGAFSKSARSTPIARSRHIFPTVRIDCGSLRKFNFVFVTSQKLQWLQSQNEILDEGSSPANRKHKYFCAVCLREMFFLAWSQTSGILQINSRVQLSLASVNTRGWFFQKNWRPSTLGSSSGFKFAQTEKQPVVAAIRRFLWVTSTPKGNPRRRKCSQLKGSILILSFVSVPSGRWGVC